MTMRLNRRDIVGLAFLKVTKGTNEVRLNVDVTNTGGSGQNFTVIWHLLDSANAVILEDSNTVYLDRGNTDTYRGNFTIAELTMVPDGVYGIDAEVWNNELTEMFDSILSGDKLEIVSPTAASLANFQVRVI